MNLSAHHSLAGPVRANIQTPSMPRSRRLMKSQLTIARDAVIKPLPSEASFARRSTLGLRRLFRTAGLSFGTASRSVGAAALIDAAGITSLAAFRAGRTTRSRLLQVTPRLLDYRRSQRRRLSGRLAATGCFLAARRTHCTALRQIRLRARATSLWRIAAA